MTTRLAASQYPLLPGLNVPCALLCSSSDGTNEVWSLGRVMKAMPMNSCVKDSTRKCVSIWDARKEKN